MTTVANIAQRVLDENGYNVTDFSGLTLTILEYKIDDAIAFLNLMAGLSVSALAGSAGSKSITGTDGQILAVKTFTNMFLKAYKEKGSQASISGQSVSYLLNNPDDKMADMMIKNVINRLKDPPIQLSNDPLPNE